MRRALAELAAFNGGVFTRQQAISRGYSPRDVRLLVEQGIWTRLRHGVLVDDVLLRDAAAPERAVLEIAAARATLRHPSVGSHQSAAAAYDLPLPGQSGAVTLSSATAYRRGTPSQPILIRAAELPAEHCVSLSGVLVTSPARTAVDLSTVLSKQHAVAAVDASLHRRLTTPAELVAVGEASGHLPIAMPILAFADGRSESVLESVSRVVLAELGIPTPELQHEVRNDHGRFLGRVDFWWSRFRVAGEADGLLKYRTGEVLRLEKLRQEALEQGGYRVVRWTWEEITRTPERVAARLRRAFALAAA